VSLIDVRDIAAVAVAALTEPGHEGKNYVVTGAESLSNPSTDSCATNCPILQSSNNHGMKTK
jgi:hypothetical protein